MATPSAPLPRIRTIRENQQLSLDDLSELTGITKSHLSRVETGDRQPSVATLIKIAHALGTSVNALLGHVDSVADVVFSPGTKLFANDGVVLFPIGHSATGSLESYLVELPCGRTESDFVEHAGEECMYVLNGRMTLHLDDEVFTVEAGSAAHFDAERRHRIFAAGGADARVLLVTSGVPSNALTRYHSREKPR